MGGGYTHQTAGTAQAIPALFKKIGVRLDALSRAIANLGIQIDTVNNQLIIGSNRSLIVNGSETVGGTLDVTGSQTVGGNLSVTGTQTVGGTLDVTGNMIVGGTLSLPNGIINNAALANPISFGSADVSISGLNLPSTLTTLQSGPITVPAGFSQCAVMVTVTVGASGTSSGLIAAAYAGGVVGDTIANGLNGGSASVPAMLATTLTGLSGSFTVGVKGNYYGSAPTAGSGDAHVSALAIFAR